MSDSRLSQRRRRAPQASPPKPKTPGSRKAQAMGEERRFAGKSEDEDAATV
jgi:hypothetical protein